MRVKGLGERGILLLVVSFFVGRMQVLGIQPFAIGFIMAICFEGQLPKGWYLMSLLLGIGSSYSLTETVKYGVILGLCMMGVWILEMGNRKKMLAYYGVTGGIMVLMVEGIWGSQSVLYGENLTIILLEALLAMVFSHIFQVGIHRILVGKTAAYIKNDELIAEIILGSIVIYGIPFWCYI